MPDILLTPTGYKAFIVHMRRQFATRPVGIVEYDYVTAGNVTKSFRFNTNDEYLVAVKNSATAAWRPLTPYEQHYAHMKTRPSAINRQAIETAFSADFSQPYRNVDQATGVDSGWSGELRLICAVTSEAARSNAVYRPCQLAVHGHAPFMYSDIWRFINGYGAARTANGLGANVFRPLDTEDYR
jgi:hypothetical protein